MVGAVAEVDKGSWSEGSWSLCLACLRRDAHHGVCGESGYEQG